MKKTKYLCNFNCFLTNILAYLFFQCLCFCKKNLLHYFKALKFRNFKIFEKFAVGRLTIAFDKGHFDVTYWLTNSS